MRALVWSVQLRYVEQPPRCGNWVAETGGFEVVVDGVRSTERRFSRAAALRLAESAVLLK